MSGIVLHYDKTLWDYSEEYGCPHHHGSEASPEEYLPMIMQELGRPFPGVYDGAADDEADSSVLHDTSGVGLAQIIPGTWTS